MRTVGMPSLGCLIIFGGIVGDFPSPGDNVFFIAMGITILALTLWVVIRGKG